MEVGGDPVRGVEEICTVYVVDDDDAVCDSLVALLEPEGFTVTLFKSAEELLANLEELCSRMGDRACLLLDLHMPGKRGQELLETLAARNHPLPVVVMTGNADEKSKRRALENGAVAFLEKPVDADQLIETIRDALG